MDGERWEVGRQGLSIGGGGAATPLFTLVAEGGRVDVARAVGPVVTATLH